MSYLEYRLQPLLRYFQQADHMLKLLDIFAGKYHSLRTINRFIIFTSKNENLGYRLNDGSYFHIYQSYQDHLKIYTKEYFDPFCRQHKITLKYTLPAPQNKSGEITVSIGQLQFYQWLISNKILDFMMKYLRNELISAVP